MTKYFSDIGSSYLEQAVLASFIEEGHYASHVRRVRKACYERRTALVNAIQCYLADKMTVQHSDSGVHIVCWLHAGLTGDEVELKARMLGMGIQSLSHYYHGDISRQGIMIGFANHPPEVIVEEFVVLPMPCSVALMLIAMARNNVSISYFHNSGMTSIF